MDNFFDRFDESSSGAPDAKAANFFDQFDSGDTASPERAKPAGLTANTLAGVNETIASVAGAPADLAQGAVNLGARAVNAVAGTELPTDTQSPLGSDAIKGGMEAIGIPTDSVVPQTAGERLARGAGQGIGGTLIAAPAAALIKLGAGPLSRAIAPMVESMIPTRTAQVVGDTAVGAVAGTTGAALEEIAPEPLKPTANLIGNVVGGIGAATAGALPAVARAGARQAADYVAPLTFRGQERLAGEALRDAATDPQAALRALDDGATDAVPGSVPTTFQQTGDMGLGALERGIAADRPEVFMKRRADQNVARRDALDGIQRDGRPESVSLALNDRLSQIREQADTALRQATDTAAKRARSVGGSANPEEYGLSIRGALQQAKQAADEHERALWTAIDPDDTLALPMAGTKAASRRVIEEMPELARRPRGEEADIFSDVVRFGADDAGDVVPFRELTALRTRLNDALREERTMRGETQTYRRLSILRGAVETDIDGAVQNIAARQADAVAQGVMREEDTLFAVVRGWTEKWLGERSSQSEMGQSAAEGFGGNASRGQGFVRPRFGTSGPHGRRSAEAASGQGIQGAQPLAANFDEGAAERLKAASAATKQSAETFGRRSVSDTLQRPMAEGAYNVPDSGVGQRFFVAGTNGFARVNELRRASGDAKALLDLEDYAAHDLRRFAEGGDGTLDPAKVTVWRSKHSEALRAFPKLDRRLANARTASETAKRVMEDGKARISAEEKHALGALLSVKDPSAVVRTVGSLFGRRESADLVKELATRLEGNATAQAGLRKAVTEHITDRFVANTEGATSGQDLLRSDPFQTFVRHNEAALRAVFTEAEVKTLGDIAADLHRSNRSVAALRLPNGSNTAQDIAAMNKAGQETSILSQILSGGGGAAAGATLAGPVGAIAGVVGAGSVNHFRNAGLRTIGDLVTDAMLNPERAKLLLSRVTPTKASSPAMQRDFGRLYRQAAIVPGTAAALDTVPERDLRAQVKVVAEQIKDAAPEARKPLMQQRAALEREIDKRAAAPAIDVAAAEAATSPKNQLPEPTQAQKEAGNYKMGHVSLAGMDISIENPAGSERKGVDKGGKPWSITMKSHYGYIKGTVGRDKDHVDAFVRPGTSAVAEDAPVFVVDQVVDGKFDEHKVMLGFGSVKQAEMAYRANYSRGWNGVGGITKLTATEFKSWLKDGDANSPLAKQN